MSKDFMEQLVDELEAGVSPEEETQDTQEDFEEVTDEAEEDNEIDEEVEETEEEQEEEEEEQEETEEEQEEEEVYNEAEESDVDAKLRVAQIEKDLLIYAYENKIDKDIYDLVVVNSKDDSKSAIKKLKDVNKKINDLVEKKLASRKTKKVRKKINVPKKKKPSNAINFGAELAKGNIKY